MSTVSSVTFDVIGTPAPQGSKRAFVVGRRAIVVDDNKASVTAWRDSVASKAREMRDKFGRFDGALSLHVLFTFPMPTSRSAALKRVGLAWKFTKPDASKLLRAVEDGLTAGGLIADDARIAVLHVQKVEVDSSWSGATITVSQLEPITAGEILTAIGVHGR